MLLPFLDDFCLTDVHCEGHKTLNACKQQVLKLESACSLARPGTSHFPFVNVQQSETASSENLTSRATSISSAC